MKALLRACLLLIASLILIRGSLVALSEDFLISNQERLDRLFDQLQTTDSRLRQAKDNWNAGKHSQAAHELLVVLKSQPDLADRLEPIDLPANLQEQAEAALHNSFFILGNWIDLKPRGSHLDWQQPDPTGDKEPAWMLNRHTILPILAEWHRATGDNRYADKASALVCDWVLANPYPNRLSFSPSWRALEVARRILNAWVHVYFTYDCLTPEAQLLLLGSIPDHADALLEHTSFWGGNHLLTEKLALLQLSIAFPIFTDSPKWQSDALRELGKLFMDQSYPDGSYTELSNHYQRVVLVNARTFKRLIKDVPEKRLPPGLLQRLENMWDFFAGVTRPDGTGPLNNAGDLERNAFFLKEVWEDYNRPDWLYIATAGQAGTPPAGDPSRLYPWAGQAILRNGFRPQDSWVYFDAGPFGTAHQHYDRLHVSAFLKGQNLLVDSGRYTYQPGPWKDFFIGPQSHNTLLLDGQAATPGPLRAKTPLPLALQSTPEYSFAEAVAHFSPKGTIPIWSKGLIPWSRALLLDHRGFLLIIDHLQTSGPHRLDALWNFHPSIAPELATQSIQLAGPTAQRSTAFGQSNPIAGFYSPDYDRKLPNPQLRYTLQLKQPTILVWLVQSPQDTPHSLSVSQKDGVLIINVAHHSSPVASAKLIQRKRWTLIDYKSY